jgi:hypothetical protein
MAGEVPRDAASAALPCESIWACLLHVGCNLWADRVIPGQEQEYPCFQPYLRCEDDLWAEVTDALAAAGANMVVLDLADGVRYDSHPEIAVRDAWSTDRLRRELARLRRLGLEPIPKLNFSACHDAWMGPYARMVSSDTYYGVCRDLIAEVIDLFDRPRLFHLGMDEETAEHQRTYEYVVIRQHDLWWRDLYFYLDEVAKGGARSWVWSDFIWHHPDEYLARMPREVLQSNWYYAQSFSLDASQNPHQTYVRAYLQLEEKGFDQVPTGSNHSYPDNLAGTVAFAREHIAPVRRAGYLQSVWRPTQARYRDRLLEAARLLGQARQGA